MTFTVDWFSEHIPVWEKEVLPRMTASPSYLEIGSFEGRSLLWMLDNVPNLQATSVDPHLIDDGSFERLRANIGLRATLLRQTSKAALPLLVNRPTEFDAIYIDGSHWADDVLFDSVLSWTLLKIGGVMIWDDYEWTFERTPLERPKLAVDAFLTCYAGCYKLLHKGYQVLIEKLSEACHAT